MTFYEKTLYKISSKIVEMIWKIITVKMWKEKQTEKDKVENVEKTIKQK